jgi:hypothetical protein
MYGVGAARPALLSPSNSCVSVVSLPPTVAVRRTTSWTAPCCRHSYLMECNTLETQIDLVRRLPPNSRIFAVGRQLLTWRQHRATVRQMAALVVQSVWRGRRRRRRASQQVAGPDGGPAEVGAGAGAGGGGSGSRTGSVSGGAGLQAQASVGLLA